MTEGPVCFHTKVNQLFKKKLLNMKPSLNCMVGKSFFNRICKCFELKFPLYFHTTNRTQLKCMNDGVDFN